MGGARCAAYTLRMRVETGYTILNESMFVKGNQHTRNSKNHIILALGEGLKLFTLQIVKNDST